MSCTHAAETTADDTPGVWALTHSARRPTAERCCQRPGIPETHSRATLLDLDSLHTQQSLRIQCCEPVSHQVQETTLAGPPLRRTATSATRAGARRLERTPAPRLVCRQGRQ